MTGSLADYYHWEETGRGIRIYLHAAMANRLQAEAVGSAREVGGILLGRAKQDCGKAIVFIDEFVPVPCSYRDGPLYRLSGEDTIPLESALLQAALAGCRSPDAVSVLGYYRSHRREGLSLDPGDLAVIDSYFQTPSSVFLLVKAVAGNQACTAGFFFWEDGSIQSEFSSLEVALGRTLDRESPHQPPSVPAEPQHEMGGDDLPEDLTELFPQSVPPEPPVHVPPLPAVVAAGLVAPLPNIPRAWPGLLLRAGTIAIATAALVISVMTYLGSRPPREDVVATRPAASGLGLRVERNAPDLLVSWDANAREILAARHATLTIRDGLAQKVLNLDKTGLSAGSNLYTPTGDDVTFRLEVFGADGGSVSQSIRVSGVGPRS